MNEEIEQPPRSALDVTIFGLACLGFFVAAGGVTVSSMPAAVVGLVLLALSLGYFYAGGDGPK